MLDMIDLLGSTGHDLRSSIVLTYSLDLPLYDGLIRRTLNRNGIWNQITFCDFSSYVQDLYSQMPAQYAGRHYSVSPILQQGAFHPKVYMLLGPRQGCLLIGSGNATIGGLIRNAEVFGLFNFDAEKQAAPHVAFSIVFGLVEGLATYASDTVRKQVKTARQMAMWLNVPGVEDGRKVLVGGPGREDLFSQIKSCLSTNRSDSLFICSSSFDRKLLGMKKLASLCKSKPTCIVQPQYAEIDGDAVKKLNSMIEWRPFVDPYRKEKHKRKDVRAHAKIFVFGQTSFSFAIFEPLVLLEKSSRQMSLGGKNKPIFTWIVWNGDPIQVYRLFESHGILQLFDLSVSLRLSDCPDSSPGPHLGAGGSTSRCRFSH